MRKNKFIVMFLTISLVINFPLYTADIPYKWYFAGNDRVKLVLYIPKYLCKDIHNKVVFIFLSNTGKVYKTTYRKTYNCKVIKKLKNTGKFRVLMFNPKSMKVYDIGVIKKPAQKVY